MLQKEERLKSTADNLFLPLQKKTVTKAEKIIYN